MTELPPDPSPDEIARIIQELDLQIEYIEVAKASAFGRKARTHSKKKLELLAKVLKEFGCIVPLVIDESGKVLAGNARVDAARIAGIKRLPAVRITHLSETQKRLFVIADNRLAELAGWDKDTLRIEFSELLELDLSDEIELSGFTEVEIEGLSITPLNDDGQADKVPELTQQPVSRRGDLWILGQHRLLCGDSTQAAEIACLLDAPARTVFTDPPYNLKGRAISKDVEHGTFVMGSGEMSDEDFTRFLEASFTSIREALTPGGLAYVCMDHRHMHNMIDAGRRTGLELLNLIVWDKVTGGMGSFYRSRHELIFLFKKSGDAHTNRVNLGANGRDRTNVWAYPGVSGFGAEKARTRAMHPTVKPTALVRDALLDSSARDEVVIDFFSGSGTTLIAAEQSGRRGRAVELDPRYVDCGVTRWQDYTGKEARLATTGETFTEIRSRRAADAHLQVEKEG